MVKNKIEDIYFGIEDPPTEFFSTGCTLLDRVLGGGIAERRIFNVIGDKSVGKTLLMIELFINFILKYGPDNCICYYHETEAAFDKYFARRIGLPINHIKFVGEEENKRLRTVEDFCRSLSLISIEANKPVLYILDSLDALSSEAELARDISTDSYATEKASKMSETFRKLAGDLEEKNITLGIVSQIRDRMVKFGKKTGRSGGRALNFYASQIIELIDTGSIKKTVGGLERIIARKIKAQCTKNKVSEAWKECEFPIFNNFGINDVLANLNWLKSVKAEDELKGIGIEKNTQLSVFARKLYTKNDRDLINQISNITIEKWNEIDEKFKYGASKYEGLL